MKAIKKKSILMTCIIFQNDHFLLFDFNIQIDNFYY